MKNDFSSERFTPLDKRVLVTAEILLQPERPDYFDYRSLAALCAIDDAEVRRAYPFPELLAVGSVAVGWVREKETMTAIILAGDSWQSQAVALCQCYSACWLRRPNSFQLSVNGWQPDPELIRAFDSHPAVQTYNGQHPALLPMLRRIWPQSGVACRPEDLLAALHNRLYMIIGTVVGRFLVKGRTCTRDDLMTNFLDQVGVMLSGPERIISAPQRRLSQRISDV